jgi:hypothetical protein
MKHAPARITALLFLAVFLCLNFTTASACNECLCFSDNTCSEDECLPGLTTNCTRNVFTPACDGDYIFYSKVVCGSICPKCMSCVSIYKLTGGVEYFVADIHNNSCNVGVCESSTLTVNMSNSQTYVMYVCKIPCPDGLSTCESCSASCTAYGCIAHGLSTTQCGP